MFGEKQLLRGGMPILEGTVTMGGHYRILNVLMVGIEGQTGNRRVVGVPQHVLEVAYNLISNSITLGRGHDPDTAICTPQAQEHILGQVLARVDR